MRSNHTTILLCSIIASTFFLTGCKLAISNFLVPDSTETGRVITLSLNGTAQDMDDNATEYGLVLQIPQGWEVLAADFASGDLPLGMGLSENADIGSQYLAEPNHSIWAGTYSTTRSGNNTVKAEAYVLTGDFAGNVGATQDYTLKASVGAVRNDNWEADDPPSIINFANIDTEPYIEEISLEKVIDTQAPAPVDPSVEIHEFGDGRDDVRLSWHNYDEKGQVDVVEYRIYMETEPFTDVSGMTPKATEPHGTTYHNFYDLNRGQTYYFAITAVDEVPHENTSVTPTSITIPSPMTAILSILLEE